MRNNPIKCQDPSGHAACIDGDCAVLHHPKKTKRYINRSFGTANYWYEKRGAAQGLINIPDLGLFDVKHIHRGYQSAAYLINSLTRLEQIGGGTLAASSNSDVKFEVNYAISRKLSGDAIVGAAFAIFMDFERKYETFQGSGAKGITSMLSSFAPDDTASDILGFSMYTQGYDINQLPIHLYIHKSNHVKTLKGENAVFVDTQ